MASRRRPLDQALVGDVGVGPLVDADEGGAGRLGHGERRAWRALARTLMPIGRPTSRRTRSAITAMHGGRLRAEVVGLEERDVAVVLDDQRRRARRRGSARASATAARRGPPPARRRSAGEPGSGREWMTPIATARRLPKMASSACGRGRATGFCDMGRCSSLAGLGRRRRRASALQQLAAAGRRSPATSAGFISAMWPQAEATTWTLAPGMWRASFWLSTGGK